MERDHARFEENMGTQEIDTIKKKGGTAVMSRFCHDTSRVVA
jgi:hypothetical protein